MNLPIKFPSDAEVVAEGVARFRALSPEDRIRSIRGLLASGAMMMHNSPKAEFLRDYAEKEKNLERQAIKEFIARHVAN